MATEITIDAVGRLVVPKRFRERLGLRAGSRLSVVEDGGRLILTPGRPEPRLVEREGFLAVDLGTDPAVAVDSRLARGERLAQLVEYALRR